MPRTPAGLAASGALAPLAGSVGYFHEDDEGGELVFQEPTGSLDGLPREDEVFAGTYGTIVRSPEEKAKLRWEFLLSGAALKNGNRLGPSAAGDAANAVYNKDNYNQNSYYRYKSKYVSIPFRKKNFPGLRPCPAPGSKSGPGDRHSPGFLGFPPLFRSVRCLTRAS